MISHAPGGCTSLMPLCVVKLCFASTSCVRSSRPCQTPGTASMPKLCQVSADLGVCGMTGEHHCWVPTYDCSLVMHSNHELQLNADNLHPELDGSLWLSNRLALVVG
jgi:hypothetical protein